MAKKTITANLKANYEKVMAYQKKHGSSKAEALRQVGMAQSSFHTAEKLVKAGAPVKHSTRVSIRGKPGPKPKAVRKKRDKLEALKLELTSPPSSVSDEGLEVIVVRGDPVKAAEFLERYRR